jgi:hypothetical protein
MSKNIAKVAGVDVSTDHFIYGCRMSSSERFTNFSPVDGSHLADLPLRVRPMSTRRLRGAQGVPSLGATWHQGHLPYVKPSLTGFSAPLEELPGEGATALLNGTAASMRRHPLAHSKEWRQVIVLSSR